MSFRRESIDLKQLLLDEIDPRKDQKRREEVARSQRRTAQKKLLRQRAAKEGFTASQESEIVDALGELIVKVDKLMQNNLYGIQDIRPHFESRYRIEGDLTEGRISFALADYAASSSDGKTGIDKPLNNIIEMEIYQFRVPNALKTTDYTTAEHYEYHFRQVELYIEEFEIQSIKNVNGARHHFTFEVQTDNQQYLKLIPIQNKFTFPNPTSTSHMTFQFMYMGYKLGFFPEKYDDAIVSYTNPARITTLTDHGLSDGSCVIFTNFSGTPDSDAKMQNVFGHQVTVVTPTVFDLKDVDLAGQGPNPATTSFQVLERFIEIPMRFRLLVDETTNHIIPV